MIEAMKLALEALERLKAYGNVFRFRQDEQNPYDQACKAIAILRTAIEQAEKQEPVAEVIQFDGEKIIDASMAFFDKYPIGTKLYITPPQREWVGLTEEDKEAIYEEYVSSPQSFMEITEAKLKEKNS